MVTPAIPDRPPPVYVSSAVADSLCRPDPQRPLRRSCGSCSNCLCSGADDVEHALGLREHRHVAAVELIGGCAHALGHGALQIGMHGAVFFADDVPARLRLPGGPPDFRVEQVGFRDALGCPTELLLLLRKVPTEILRAVRTQPDTSIHDFDVGEDVGPREVGLLRLRRFIGVWSERADVNQPDNTIVGSGSGDDASAVGVSDEDNGAAYPAQRCFHQGDVLCRCVKAVLRRNTLIPLCLKWNDQIAEARAIGPESVTKHDAWFGLRRCHFLLPIDSLIFASYIARTSPRSCMIWRSLACLTFLVCLLSALLSQHPLPDVRRTAQYRDAGALTLISKTNS